MEEKTVKKEIEQIKENVKEIMNYDKVEEMLSSNELNFDFKDVKYKVKKPSFEQKLLANQKKVSKYVELLETKDDKGNFIYKSEKEMRKIYKDRGIDIDDLDKQYSSVETARNNLLLKLGKAIKDEAPDKEMQVYRDEIKLLFNRLQEISMEKAVLLDTTIESQVNIFIFTYLAFLSAEKLVEDKWIKAWETYESFVSEEEGLVNTVVWHISLLSKDENN